MSVATKNTRVHDHSGHQHVVGVYDCDEALVSTLAEFFADALDHGGSAVVVGAAPHRHALEAALVSRGFALDELARAGRYEWLDADATLAKFMVGDIPDRNAFISTLGAVLDRAAVAGGPVRLFGEMVALLWDAGNLAAAIELESLWNELAEKHSFALFCAYELASLEASGDLAAAKEMCDRHSSVVPLADWRANGAAPSFAAGRDRVDRLFVATPLAPRDVRVFVREALRAWGASAVGSAAEVIASELATNAIRHARSPFRVSVSQTSDAIRIAVRDASFETPQELERDITQLGGRGVQLVAALSRARGVVLEVDGKTVWADVARGSV